MTKNCLVTGGAGFIGCAISSLLKEHFDRIVVVDNLHPQVHPTHKRPDALDPKVELFIADVTAEETWDSLLPDFVPHTVIHLAAETGTGQSLTEGTRHAQVNVVGTTRMLDAFVKHSCVPSRIILTSSRAVYGEGAWSDAQGNIFYPGQRSQAMLAAGEWNFPGLTCLPFDAMRTATHPTSIYGATKLTQELVVQAWALSFGVETGVLRLQNVYGPGQSLSNPYTGIVPLFARIARGGQSIPLYEDGEIVRDFVYIDDVARAVVRMAIGSIPSSVAYDIGSGTPTTIRQLAEIIAHIYSAPKPVVNGKFRNGDVRAASGVVTRAKTDLGWLPQWGVETGVRALCSWIDSTLPIT
ncbi:MAG: NAD-dependent epimerase/dehydratase family protein [Acetobacter orientalis]|uniref:NAD-dependent epimerase/dehydratase family protein n=1 Tax=Acetobacter orientalis TaxID=146474 RepID=UPI0039EB360A